MPFFSHTTPDVPGLPNDDHQHVISSLPRSSLTEPRTQRPKAELFDATVRPPGFWPFLAPFAAGVNGFPWLSLLENLRIIYVCVCVRGCMYISVYVYIYKYTSISSYICTTLNTLDNMTSVEREVLSVISTSRSTVS